MRLYMFFSVLIAAIVIVECTHTFMGTSVYRQLVYRKDARYSSKFLRKRVENITYSIPPSYGFRRTIQVGGGANEPTDVKWSPPPIDIGDGILAYDLTNSSASANVTAGGLGYSFVTLRMKSARGSEIHYDINIYA